MNLIHGSAICCSAVLLPLLPIGCLCANCFDNAGEAQNNFSRLGQQEGSGADPAWCWAITGLSRATGQTLAPGHEGQLCCVRSGGKADIHTLQAIPGLPQM